MSASGLLMRHDLLSRQILRNVRRRSGPGKQAAVWASSGRYRYESS